jgi:hypothetical protein
MAIAKRGSLQKGSSENVSAFFQGITCLIPDNNFETNISMNSMKLPGQGFNRVIEGRYEIVQARRVRPVIAHWLLPSKLKKLLLPSKNNESFPTWLVAGVEHSVVGIISITS